MAHLVPSPSLHLGRASSAVNEPVAPATRSGLAKRPSTQVPMKRFPALPAHLPAAESVQIPETVPTLTASSFDPPPQPAARVQAIPSKTPVSSGAPVHHWARTWALWHERHPQHHARTPKALAVPPWLSGLSARLPWV